MMGRAWAVTIFLFLSIGLSQQSPAQNEASYLPDPQLTPGRAGRATAADICNTDYDNPAEEIPVELKGRVLVRYGIGRYEVGYNIDHLIPPKLGGTNSINNLWPQPLAGLWCWHRKNRLERRLRKLVCSGQLSLEQAQREIATDWISAYKKYIGMPKQTPPP
jgi:hypothetical protein